MSLVHFLGHPLTIARRWVGLATESNPIQVKLVFKSLGYWHTLVAFSDLEHTLVSQYNCGKNRHGALEQHQSILNKLKEMTPHVREVEENGFFEVQQMSEN